MHVGFGLRWGAALGLLCVLFGAPWAAAQGEGLSTGSIANTAGAGANCRAAAGPAGEVITVLAEGESVELAGAPTGEWQPVACAGLPGYVHRDYVVAAPSAAVVSMAAPGRGVAIGVMPPAMPFGPGEIDAVRGLIGRTPAIVMWYQAWGDDPNWAAFQPDLFESVASRGATPLVTWEPRIPDGHNADQPTYRLRNIVRGDFDSYIDQWASGLAAFGRPVYLRFAHEMNGTWYPWGGNVNGNSPRDYVAAWRYVHDRFTAAGAENVRWVWAPNADWYEGQTPMAQLYPGDAYVDWLGLSGFNWGTTAYWEECDCTSQWQTFETLFGTSYETLVRIAYKPIMIAEMGTAEEGGNKSDWIDGLATLLPQEFPRIRALVWFNADYQVDWRIDTSTEAIGAFARLSQHPYFQATLP